MGLIEWAKKSLSKMSSEIVKKSINELINQEKKSLTTTDVRPKLELLNGGKIGNWNDLHKANTFLTLSDGGKILLYRNPADAIHIFLVDPQGKCVYGRWFWWATEKQKAIDTLEDIRKIVQGY